MSALESKIDAMAAELAALRAEVAAMQRPTKRRIVPANEAWRELGYKNYAALWRKIGADRLYRPGYEVSDRRDPGAKSPVWYFDLEKCAARDEQIAAMRN